MVAIRQFQTDDLEPCVQLFISVYALAPWNEHWPMQNAIAHLSELVHTPGFMGFVAPDEHGVQGGLLGHLQHWSGGLEFVIDEIWVDPLVQRTGIGTQLMNRAKLEIAAAGAHNITLWTHIEAAATRFYAQNGFTELRERRFYHLAFDEVEK